jgi:hypothetical protein
MAIGIVHYPFIGKRECLLANRGYTGQDHFWAHFDPSAYPAIPDRGAD